MNLDLLYALTTSSTPIIAKNVGMAVADGLSMGVASAFKKSVEEIKERADQSNENIFYWQVASFLEASSDVPIEEVTRFLEQHPQGSLYTTNFTEPLSYQGSAFLKLPKFP